MKKAFLAFLLVFLIPTLAAAQAGRKKVHQGNSLYKEKKYDAALGKYQDALLDAPDSPRIRFNVGNALYQKNTHEKAVETYQKALATGDVRLQSQLYYNVGNGLYRQGKLAESILAYEQALKLNPNDMDAKYNLEFVRNKLKENAKPQQSLEQQQQNQEGKENERPQDQNQKPQPQDQRQEDQKASQQQRPKQEMSKEEAEQLLNALNENKKQSEQKTSQTAGGSYVEKDW